MSDTNIITAIISILICATVCFMNRNKQDLASTILKSAPYIAAAALPFVLSVLDKATELSLIKTPHSSLLGFNVHIDIKAFSMYLFAAIYVIPMVIVWAIRKVVSRSNPFETNINKSLKKELQSPEYRDYIKKCKHNLDMIDESTGWKNNSGKYVKLNVDVSITINGKEKNGKKELIDAILNGRYKDNIIKIIGEPGSGKSVSLRELYRQILNKTVKYGRIPVYINMNSWVKTWKGESPTQEDFERYIKETMLASCSINSKKFVNENFDKITINHGWFFILDSFDEIPFLTCTIQNSELVNGVSTILYNFLDEVGGGIVASRPHLTPTDSFLAKTVLEINAFDDIRIFRYLNKSMKLNKDVVKRVFTEMPNILEAMKNPFYCSLIDGYYSSNHAFPHNLNELFEYSVDNRIKNSDLPKEDLVEFCIYAANFMITSGQYLSEIPINKLLSEIKLSSMGKNASEIIQQLVQANIMRTANSDKSVLFVHRRFQEYFYIQKLIKNDEVIKAVSERFLDNCTDLDIAYLLVEIATDEKAKIFIDKCCETICDDKINYNASVLPETQRALNALFFLNIYCQNHRESMLEQRARVTQFIQKIIHEKINKCNDIITLKHIANSLLVYYPSCDVIFKSLSTNKQKSIIPQLLRRFYSKIMNKSDGFIIFSYLDKVPIFRIIFNFDYYWFILGLSNRKYSLWIVIKFAIIIIVFSCFFLFAYAAFNMTPVYEMLVNKYEDFNAILFIIGLSIALAILGYIYNILISENFVARIILSVWDKNLFKIPIITFKNNLNHMKNVLYLSVIVLAFLPFISINLDNIFITIIFLFNCCDRNDYVYSYWINFIYFLCKRINYSY
jgi:uridine kinase